MKKINNEIRYEIGGKELCGKNDVICFWYRIKALFKRKHVLISRQFLYLDLKDLKYCNLRTIPLRYLNDQEKLCIGNFKIEWVRNYCILTQQENVDLFTKTPKGPMTFRKVEGIKINSFWNKLPKSQTFEIHLTKTL